MTLNRTKSAADRILARYGGQAVLSRTTTTGGGPADPTGGTVTTETHNVQFIEVAAKAEFLSAGLILSTDLTGIMQPSEGITAKPGDVLTLNGKSHFILNAAPVRPAPGGPVIHISIHARA